MRTILLFFVIGVMLLFGLPQMLANSIFPVSPLPMTSAASGEEMFAVFVRRVMDGMQRALQRRT